MDYKGIAKHMLCRSLGKMLYFRHASKQRGSNGKACTTAPRIGHNDLSVKKVIEYLLRQYLRLPLEQISTALEAELGAKTHYSREYELCEV